MMRKWLSVMVPLVLIIVMSSLNMSSTGAAETDYTPAEQAPDTKSVYIEQFDTSADGARITVDEIQWFEGEEAEKAFQRYEPEAGIDGPLDGYYIVNDDGALTSYPVAEDVRIIMQIYDRTGEPEDIEIQWNEQVSLPKFLQMFQNTEWIDVRGFPYHITVKDGVIVQIVQQYIP